MGYDPSGRKRLYKRLEKATNFKEWLAAWRYKEAPEKKTRKRQAERMVHRKTRRLGAAHYFGQKVCRKMQEAGYPSKIFYTYRSPDLQNNLYAKGRSKAKAFHSPHQWYEAVDIVHETLFWNVDQEYWETLATCVRVVASELNLDVNHGHHWKWVDSAHIEITDWRNFRREMEWKHSGRQKPTEKEVLERFVKLLPNVPLSQSDKTLLES